MSDDRVLRPQADAGISKRGRKARLSFTDDDKQRERKRAMDRKAQRVSREKTRSHIAHLEKMVSILCEKNESEATTELMAEVSRLNQEIDRLRKIIETIRSVLRADSFERENQAQHNSSSNGSRGGSRARDIQDAGVDLFNDSASAPPRSPPPVLEDSSMEEDQSSNTTAAAVVTAIKEVASSPINSSMDCTSEPSLCFSDSWDSAIVPRTRARARPSQPPDVNQLWAKLYPSLPTSPPQRIPHAAPCRLWQTTNRIYAKMFNIKLSRCESADEISTGSLFKAVKDGWGALRPEELRNPVLEVLREIDQKIFPRLDRVTRVALMHKSHLLMKYFLNSDEKNWQHMPLWQRPVPSQSTKQHPIAIDFFAWPCLRDRLVSQHPQYFSTSSFSLAYQRHFRFSWPFTFDDAYLHDPETDTYSMAPLFAKYHGELRYWGMEEAFFERFPELHGEIGVAHGYEMENGDKVSVNSPADSGVGTGSPEEGEGLGEFEFEIGTQVAAGAEGLETADEYMMELFNELPCLA